MLSDLSLGRKKVKIRHLGVPLNNKTDLVVYWYGGIEKNRIEPFQPRVTVFLRILNPDNTLGNFTTVKVPLTHLGQFRIGSIWNEGISNSEIIFPTQQTQKFQVNFTQDSYSFVSPWEELKNGRNNPIDQNNYPLKEPFDKSWLLNFPLRSSKNLLIPCLEFFYRLYGRSGEIKRTLATLRWEAAEDRLFRRKDQATENIWPVYPGRYLQRGDSVLLAHLAYDKFAKKMAQDIYSQIESTFRNGGKLAFITAGPWFQGKATLKVKGIWINEGRTFLGLQILGASDPTGPDIIYNQPSPEPSDGTETNNAPPNGAPQKVLKKSAEVANLTDQEAPDHSPCQLEVEDPEFEIIGKPRTIENDGQEYDTAPYKKHYIEEQIDTFSSGDPYGAPKDIGKAVEYARPVMESEGTLRDMWNALLFIAENHPDVISSVEWYTHEDLFKATLEPYLIKLEPFETKDKGSLRRGAFKWPFYNVKTGELRGVLVVKVTLEDKVIHLIEIQRRKKKEQGTTLSPDESYKGLVFQLNNQNELDAWLRTLLKEVREHKGVFQNIANKCPGKVATFSHKPSEDDEVPCEAAVRNALKKMGVSIKRKRKKSSKTPSSH